MMQYELKLADGKRVVWEGRDPEDASRRYVDHDRTAAVVGWRHYPRHGVFVWGGAQIIEPNDPRWKRER